MGVFGLDFCFKKVCSFLLVSVKDQSFVRENVIAKVETFLVWELIQISQVYYPFPTEKMTPYCNTVSSFLVQLLRPRVFLALDERTENKNVVFNISRYIQNIEYIQWDRTSCTSSVASEWFRGVFYQFQIRVMKSI